MNGVSFIKGPRLIHQKSLFGYSPEKIITTPNTKIYLRIPIHSDRWWLITGKLIKYFSLGADPAGPQAIQVERDQRGHESALVPDVLWDNGPATSMAFG